MFHRYHSPHFQRIRDGKIIRNAIRFSGGVELGSSTRLISLTRCIYPSEGTGCCSSTGRCDLIAGVAANYEVKAYELYAPLDL